MKTKTILLLLLVLSAFLYCDDDKEDLQEWRYAVFNPTYASYEEIRETIQLTNAHEIKNVGKIYPHKNYLLINEKNRGIHVLDNSDPSHPQNIGFINIPKNNNFIIKDDILYADSYVNIIGIDISDINNISIAKYLLNPVNNENVYYFSYDHIDAKNVYDLPISNYIYNPIDITKGIVIGWEFVGYTTEHVDQNITRSKKHTRAPSPILGFFDTELFLNKFTIVGNTLFIYQGQTLFTYNTELNEAPESFNYNSVDFYVEKLIPLNDRLILIEEKHMYIYSISQIHTLTKVSRIKNITSCDSVIGQGDYIYVTRRAGTECSGDNNKLNIYNISDINNPNGVKSYEMVEPYNLAINDDRLFISEGTEGLKVYDASDPLNLDLLFHDESVQAYDVIITEESAVVLGADGIYQYDYSDINNLKLLSKTETVPDENNQ